MNNFYYLNGRVNAMDTIPNAFNIEKEDVNITENPNNMVSRNLNCSAVSDMFFSTQNINLIQIGIRNRILNESEGLYFIGRQSDDELKIIMRSIYFQHSKNLPNNVMLQVKELNTRVIDWAVPQIMTNLKQDDKYKVDISTLPEPLERSQLPSTKGTRVLEIKSFM